MYAFFTVENLTVILVSFTEVYLIIAGVLPILLPVRSASIYIKVLKENFSAKVTKAYQSIDNPWNAYLDASTHLSVSNGTG